MNYDKVFGLRLSADDYDRLVELGKSSGLGMSGYLRFILRGFDGVGAESTIKVKKVSKKRSKEVIGGSRFSVAELQRMADEVKARKK